MSDHTRKQRKEGNRLRKHKQQLKIFRKDTETLKALTTGNAMMQMLGKAFRKKLQPFMTQPRYVR